MEEEDEALLYFNSTGDMNSSFLDASDDIEMVITEDEDDQSPSSSSNTPTKLRGMSRSSSSSTPVKKNNNFGMKYSQQTTSELKVLFQDKFEKGNIWNLE